MNNSNLLKILAIASGLILAFLFKHETWGLNTFIFSLFLVLVFAWNKGLSGFSGPLMILSIGTLFSSILIVVNNSGYAKVTWVFSLVLWMGFQQKLPVKSFLNAGALGVVNFFESPFRTFAPSADQQKFSFWRSFWRKTTLLAIPLGLLVTFYLIYYKANAKFAQFSDKVFDVFQRFPNIDIDPNLIILILTGVMLFGGIFFHSGLNEFFHKKEEPLSENLTRKRRKIQDYFASINTLSLKKEYRIGILVLALLNLQLFIVNIIDIIYVWFSFEERSAPELSQFVHEGTYLLILAIVLAMAVILWFFRGNINFLPNNKFIKQLVYAWMIQNALLTLSVGMRNFHYIQSYGLAYKRVGVFFFLALVMYGLWTVKEKVQAPKTFFYLLQKNAWFFYFTLLVFSSINWNVAITKFNLSKNPDKGIDSYFLIHSIPDHNLYVLLENKDKLLSGTSQNRNEINIALERKKAWFLGTQNSQTWKSFNFPDWRNKRFLKKWKKG